jgi:hypothetical protein
MSKPRFEILQKEEWNTGRMYAHNGQPIAAYVCALDGERFVFFRDRARMIDGIFELPDEDAFDLKWLVMYQYDHNLYNCWRAGGEHGISTFEVARLIKETTGEHA